MGRRRARYWNDFLVSVVNYMFMKNRGDHISFKRRKSFSVQKLCATIKRNKGLLERYLELCLEEGINEREALNNMRMIMRARLLVSIYRLRIRPIADLVHVVLLKGTITRDEWEKLLNGMSWEDICGARVKVKVIEKVRK